MAKRRESRPAQGLVNLATGIGTLDKLLKEGIQFHRESGLFGVIFGAAAAGKSIFGLQLCCRFVLEGALDPKKTQNRHAVYISQDPPELVRAKIEDKERFHYFLSHGEKYTRVQRGFLSEGEKERDPLRPFSIVEYPQGSRINTPQRSEEKTPQRNRSHDGDVEDPVTKLKDECPRVHLFGIGQEETAQRQRLENLFHILAAPMASLKKEDPHSVHERLLVCVDNVDAISDVALLGAFMPGALPHGVASRTDSHRHARAAEPGHNHSDYHRLRDSDPNFFRRLRDYCAQRRLNTFLIFEETGLAGRTAEESDISTTPQAYAADIVIRLGTQTHAMGFRDRFIEIVKAKNQFYHRGKHHCTISSRKHQPHTKEAGLVIYPSVATQLTWLDEKRREIDRDRKKEGKTNRGSGEEAPPLPSEYTLGIESLDAKISKALKDHGERKPDPTAKKGRVAGRGAYITPGSCSVLVSDLDIKATQIALHFANTRRSYSPPRSTDGRKPRCPSLFISLLHDEEKVKGVARRFRDLERMFRPQWCTLCYLPPEHISEGKLLHDINELITQVRQTEDWRQPAVVVVDNIFQLCSKFPLVGSAERFLTSLIELFRARNVTSLIVDTVEAGEARNPIEASVVAGLADNVFLLRHVEFQSRSHHVFTALKLVGKPTPERLWDLEEKTEKGKSVLEAADTFALYKNVLSGRPEPVTVSLTLYMDQEGSPFHRYLEGQVRALKEAFGPSIEANLYGADEYARVQSILTTAPTQHRSDCHVVALDEFWLERLINDGALEDIGSLMRERKDEKEYARAMYVSAAHDMVMYNMARRSERENQEFDAASWYAVPARNNCGVLCCDPLLVREVVPDKDTKLKKAVENWLDRKADAKFGWKELMRLKEPFNEKRKRHPERYPATFFSFCTDQMESCVSFLLELALSYAAEDAMVKKGKLRFEDGSAVDPDKPWARHFFDAAIATLFTLLDYPDIARIAAGMFRLPDQEPPSLFTRQWISTLGCLRAVGEKSPGGDYFLRLEPFELPVGPDRKDPTPVSGTWYVGVLKGSVAVEAGARIVGHFTSVADDLFKLNNYIGLPVRSTFYESNSPIPFVLPYRKKFVEIAKVHKEVVKSFKQNDRYDERVLRSEYPFYRMLIRDYSRVAPILWRLMVRVAKEIVGGPHLKEWRPGEVVDRRIVKARKAAKGEYESLWKKST